MRLPSIVRLALALAGAVSLSFSQPPPKTLGPAVGGGIYKSPPVTIPNFQVRQDPNLFIQFRSFSVPMQRLWASDGTPGTPPIALSSTNATAGPWGMIDAVRFPNGRRVVFATRQHNTLEAIEMPGSGQYAGSGEKVCGTYAAFAPYLSLYGGRVSRDGKFIYILAGHYGPVGGNPPSEFIWRIPILDCAATCLDTANAQQFPITPVQDLNQLEFDPTGQWIALSGDGSVVRVVSAANPSVTLSSVTLPPKGTQPRGRISISISPNLQNGHRAIYAASYEGRSLSAIRCNANGTGCTLATTYDPPWANTGYYGPNAGTFHPSGPFYYWMTGASLSGVQVINTASLFAPVDTGVSPHVNLSATGGSKGSHALAAPNGLLYVAGVYIANGHSGVAVFDISGPNAAQPVAKPYLAVQPPGVVKPMEMGGLAWVRTVPGCPPPAATVNFSTNPPGLQYTVGGANLSAPVSYQWTPGFQQPLPAPLTQYGPHSLQFGRSLVEYVFQNWSGNNCNVVGSVFTMPAANADCVANFRTRYWLKMMHYGNNTTSPAPPGAYFDAGTQVQLTSAVPAVIWDGDRSAATGYPKGSPILMDAPHWVMPIPATPFLGADLKCWVGAKPALSSTTTVKLSCANFGTAPVNVTAASVSVNANPSGATAVVTGGASINLPASASTVATITVQVSIPNPGALQNLDLSVTFTAPAGGMSRGFHHVLP